MSRLRAPALVASLFAAALISGCDGEPIDYTGERYDMVLTWVDGNLTLNTAGTYGSLGVTAADNQPGARHGAMSWKDSDGNFWLFGGRGVDSGSATGRLHDLWKYNTATGMWTWVDGENVIGGTTTHSGQGIYDAADPADNLPGARSDAVTWATGSDAASREFWLFGGQGHDSTGTFGRLNDLWKYSVASGIWTWVGGSRFVDAGGVYGTQGTADPANQPGARHSATGWVDSAGAFWLFGGSGLDGAAPAACCSLNDLWKYSGGNWTWVKGSSSKDPAPVYGVLRTPAAANTPSGRSSGASWYDADGNAWIYGGVGNSDIGTRYVSAELWRYNADGWAWMSGTQATFINPSYENRGVASLAAWPGSRAHHAAWTDSDGALWLYGGDVETAGGFVTNPSDLWKYTDSNTSWTWVGGKTFDNPGGNYVATGATGQPGGRGDAASWLGGDGRLWLFGGRAIKASLGNPARNDLWYYEP